MDDALPLSVALRLAVTELVHVPVCDGLPLSLGLDDGDLDALGEGLGLGLFEGDPVSLGDALTLGDCEKEGVPLGDTDGDVVTLPVEDPVREGLGVRVAVRVRVADRVQDGDLVMLLLRLVDLVEDGVGDGDAHVPSLMPMEALSMATNPMLFTASAQMMDTLAWWGQDVAHA